MHNVEHALTVMAQSLGVPDIRLNQEGQTELVLAQGFSAYVTKIDDVQLELSIRLPDLTYATPSMSRALLAANCLGSLSGSGRLAIDVARQEVIYCERWMVNELQAEMVDRKLATFIAHAAFWLTKGSEEVIAEGDRDVAERRAREETAAIDEATPLVADEEEETLGLFFDAHRLAGPIRL